MFWLGAIIGFIVGGVLATILWFAINPLFDDEEE